MNAEALTGVRVLLGVSGGIAAYKAADLVRRLRDAGAEIVQDAVGFFQAFEGMEDGFRSRASAVLMAGCAMPIRSPARVTFASSSIARSAMSRFRSIPATVMPHLLPLHDPIG